MGKPNYQDSGQTEDLKERAKKDYQVPGRVTQAEHTEKSENLYIGVDPVYQNYANPTEKPYLAESGPVKKLQSELVADGANADNEATPEGERPEDEDGDGGGDGGSTEGSSTGGAGSRSGSSVPAAPVPPSGSSNPPASSGTGSTN